MTKNLSKSSNMQQLRQYNKNRILHSDFSPLLLNIGVLSNPFLKDQQQYNYILSKMSQYNQKLLANEITDPYESLYYQRLHSIVYDLGLIGSKVDQITRLQQTIKWVVKQQTLIKQRKDQGIVRYIVKKQTRHLGQEIIKQPTQSQISVDDQLISEIMAKQLLPFQKHWRTLYKQLDVPSKRLSQYRRKMLSLGPLLSTKQQKKPPRVCYPKIPKIDYNKQSSHLQQLIKTDTGTITPVTDIDNRQNESKDQKQLQQKQQIKKQQKPGQPPQQPPDQNTVPQELPQQDLAILGEQKQQAEDDEEPDQDAQDKLKKGKIYSVEFQDIKRKEYTAPYMRYRGEQIEKERRMEEKYLKIIQDQIKKQKQEKQMIDLMDQWGAKKQKMEKQCQKKLQNSIMQPVYVFCTEQPVKKQMLSPEDQRRFGFTQALIKPKGKQIQLNTSFHLPQINPLYLYQRSLRKQRLKSLKDKYSKILNIKQQQNRIASNSLCQYSSRRRGISQIIYRHSKSKQRLKQLQQISVIKEQMVRNKYVIDMKDLSSGLCLPEQETTGAKLPFPNKLLLSNPYMIDSKKKKKKGKAKK